MTRKTFDKKTKEKWLKIAREHQEADRFVQWKWIQENLATDWMHRGCFFGCMMQTEEDVLETASKEMKLPEWIVHLSEKIFEWLPIEEAVLRPVQLLEAIPTNKDTEKTRKRVMKRILLDEKYWAIAYSNGAANVISAIQQCADLYDMDVIDYESAEPTAWYASLFARDARYEAVLSARAARAATAAASSAWYAAMSDYWAAARDAASSAWYAAAATAWYASSAKDRYQRFRDVLIQELNR